RRSKGRRGSRREMEADRLALLVFGPVSGDAAWPLTKWHAPMIPYFFGLTNASRGSKRGRRSSGGVPGLGALLSLLVVVAAGGAEPEIVRLRVPGRDVSRWFPAGTELRLLPAEQFESLIRSAINGVSRRSRGQERRLVRVELQPRRTAGVLAGQSGRVIEAWAGPADFVLDRWTPAVRATVPVGGGLAALDSGKPSLWIDQAPTQNVLLEWE